MKMKALMTSAKRGVHNVGFQMKKHSPEIFIGLGVAGLVASGVLACFATTKIDTIKDETKNDLDSIQRGVADGEVIDKSGDLVPYTEADGKRDTRIVRAKTALRYVRLYAPSLALGTASILLVIKGDRIINRRYAEALVAYTALDKSYAGYRARVRERFGEELDEELLYNAKVVKVEETVTDETTGKEKKVKKNVKILDSDVMADDPYTYIFDPAFTSYATDNMDYNIMHVKGVERYANHQLQSEGRLFGNELFAQQLGFRRRKALHVAGWKYDPKNPDATGDSYVSFHTITAMVDFGDGDIHEALVLRPNCEGDVWSDMPDEE